MTVVRLVLADDDKVRFGEIAQARDARWFFEC